MPRTSWIDPPSRTDSDIRWLAPLSGSSTTSGDMDFPRLWDASTGKLIAQLTNAKEEPRFSSDYATAAFSPDGDRVLTMALKKIQIWNAEDGKLVMEPKEPPNVRGKPIQDGDKVYRAMLETSGFYGDTTRLLIWQSDRSMKNWRPSHLANRMSRGVSRDDRAFAFCVGVNPEGRAPWRERPATRSL